MLHCWAFWILESFLNLKGFPKSQEVPNSEEVPKFEEVCEFEEHYYRIAAAVDRLKSASLSASLYGFREIERVRSRFSAAASCL